MGFFRDKWVFWRNVKKYVGYMAFFPLVVICSILLAGCSTVDNGEVLVGISEARQLEDFDLEALPFLIQFEDRLTVVDLLTNEVLAEFKPEIPGLIRVLDHNMQGYYSVLVVYPLDEEGNLLALETTDIAGMYGSYTDFTVDLADGSTAKGAVAFYVLDETLAVVETFEIPIPHFNFTLGVVVDHDESLRLYFAEFNHIYVYDFKTGETELAFELPSSISIVGRSMLLTAENQLLVQGVDFQAGEGDYFGLIDLTTGELQDWQIDFPIWDVVVYGDYLLLTEAILTPLGPPPTHEVMLIDLTNREEQLVQLAEGESQQAMVIENQYLLTGSMTHLRLYDLFTNEKVMERQLEIEGIEADAQQGDDEVMPYLRTFFQVETGLYAIVFDLGDGNFHTEFVRVEELE